MNQTRKNKNKNKIKGGSNSKSNKNTKEFSEGFIRRITETPVFEVIPTTPEERAATILKFQKEREEERIAGYNQYLKSIGSFNHLYKKITRKNDSLATK